MRVHVWGGTHLNEPDPLRIVSNFDAAPIDGVTQGIVDTIGKPGIREPNMNAFYDPHVVPEDEIGQQKAIRAKEIVAHNADPTIDIVVDMHNAISGDTPSSLINLDTVDRSKFRTILQFLKLIGIRHIIDFAGYTSMLSCSSKAFIIELPKQSKLSSPEFWREPLARLVANDLPPTRTTDFIWYRYALDVPLAWVHERGLPEKVTPFEELPRWVVRALGEQLEGRKMVALSWRKNDPWLGETAFVVDPPPDELPPRLPPATLYSN